MKCYGCGLLNILKDAVPQCGITGETIVPGHLGTARTKGKEGICHTALNRQAWQKVERRKKKALKHKTKK